MSLSSLLHHPSAQQQHLAAVYPTGRHRLLFSGSRAGFPSLVDDITLPCAGKSRGGDSAGSPGSIRLHVGHE